MTKLKDMVQPKKERVRETRNYGKFTISPLERGYGVTLGNALRRVLLSSLDGAAVTKMRINDVMHEFTPIPGVREDVIQVMLNLKLLRFKLHNIETAQLHIEVNGKGTITAADIICPPEVEIINPDNYLFSMNEDGHQIDIDLTVEAGRGYLPANDRKEDMPIGVLAVDAIFSPVQRVNWEVSSARVGDDTNYDRLTLEIWTDGTIRPFEALNSAADILMRHLSYIISTNDEMLSQSDESELVEKSDTKDDYSGVGIQDLGLENRIYNALNRNLIRENEKYVPLQRVLDLLEKGDSAILSIMNFGDKSLTKLKERLTVLGYLKPVDKDND